MAPNESNFTGWVGHDKKAIGNLKWEEFPPKTFEEDDIDIKVTHSGICGSDCHMLRSGWGATPYPLVVGHEIVGHVTRVGSKVENGFKIGDRVGVGAQAGSCLKSDCEACPAGDENLCPHRVDTFGAKWPNGELQQGGHALYHRAKSHFALHIPDALDSADAAPMMCGGVTVYSPLIQGGVGPGTKVAIVGLGGLGHFGILFAKALGADRVYAVSRSRAKEEDALKIGADELIATDESDWATKYANTVDVIVSTVSSSKMPLSDYLALLKLRGQFFNVGAPEDNLPGFNAFNIIPKQLSIRGSIIGSPSTIQEMLDLAAAKKVKPWVVQRPMKDANAAFVDMEKNLARYRYVLVN